MKEKPERIANCLFPSLDCLFLISNCLISIANSKFDLARFPCSSIGNWQLAIGNSSSSFRSEQRAVGGIDHQGYAVWIDQCSSMNLSWAWILALGYGAGQGTVFVGDAAVYK